MIILTIRTDKPLSEIGLYSDNDQLDYLTWEAHRQLAETINLKIKQILEVNSISVDNIEGLICYKGPGSFTGLRIGLSVFNALAYTLGIPIVGIEGEDNWLERGISELTSGKNDVSVIPEYGSPVHITTPKK